METGRPRGAGPPDANRTGRRQSASEGRPGTLGHSARADRLLRGAVRPSRADRGALAAAGSRAQGYAGAKATWGRGHYYGRGAGRVRAAMAPQPLPIGRSRQPRRTQGDSLLRLGQPPAGPNEGLAARLAPRDGYPRA